jgi:hypothetical protein
MANLRIWKGVLMELNTRVIEINGSHYVRIPASMVHYFKINGKSNATIKDVDKCRVEIVFPV